LTCFGQQFCPSSGALDCTLQHVPVGDLVMEFIHHQITDRQRIGHNISQGWEELLPETCGANLDLSINRCCCIKLTFFFKPFTVRRSAFPPVTYNLYCLETTNSDRYAERFGYSGVCLYRWRVRQNQYQAGVCQEQH
jgi:hypothetical protein